MCDAAPVQLESSGLGVSSLIKKAALGGHLLHLQLPCALSMLPAVHLASARPLRPQMSTSRQVGH